ncbi:MAG: DUF1186 domain-containing protein [Verrucomicrobia bacterium]|nr:DUF1186 domain-containing protein [Verrucomicrobiota bacterium]
MNTSKTSFESLFPDEGECLSLSFQVTKGTPSLAPGEYRIREWYGDPDACEDCYVLLEIFDPKNPTQALAEITYSWHTDDVTEETLLLNPAQFEDPAARALVEALIVHFRDQRDTAELIQSHYRRHWVKQDPTMGLPPLPPLRLLSMPDILRRLESVPATADFIPYAHALVSALECRDAIVPELIASVERVVVDPAMVQNRQGYSLHRFALYLLAEFREPRAKEAVLQYMIHPSGLSLELPQNDMVDDAARILASVFPQDPDPLAELALNRMAHALVRGQALRSLLVLYAWEELSRDTLLEILRRHLTALKPPEDILVAISLLDVINSLNLRELVPDLRVAFKQGQLEGAIESLTEFESSLGASAEVWASFIREWNQPINAIADCSRWPCFNSSEDEDEDDEPWEEEAISTPYIAPAAVGRNDPCPCGSGKKYKKCCG